MHKYELALILNAALTEDGLQAEFQKVQDILSRFGGTVEKVDNWGKRRLAYEINKMTEGFYYFIVFSANHDAPAEIESRLRITESIVRYLIIRMEEPRVRKTKEKAVTTIPAVEAEVVVNVEEAVTEPAVSEEGGTVNE